MGGGTGGTHHLADGSTLDQMRVDNLVSAMAAFAPPTATLFASLPARVAKHLLVLSELPGADGTIRISQQEMADQMATTRESINRLFSKWEQAGVVALWRGSVAIQDREALENYLTD